MKTRSDFVSNSSSCSFVIDSKSGEVRTAAELMSGVFKRALPPFEIGIEGEFNIGCFVKNKWFKEVYEALTGEKSDYEPYWRDAHTDEKIEKDPEQEEYIEIGFRSFGIIAANEDLAGKIVRVEFMCDDYDQTGTAILWLLYRILTQNGCHPDTSDSERPFFFEHDDSNFMANLFNAAFGLNKKTGEDGAASGGGAV